MNYVTDNYNLSRYNASIVIADGTYNEDNLELPQYNTTTGYIILNSIGITHRDNVIIKGYITLEASNDYVVNNLTIDQADSYSHGYAVLATKGTIDLYNVVIDSSDTVVTNGSCYSIRAEGGTVRVWASNTENQHGIIIKIPNSYNGVMMAATSGLITFSADINIQNNGIVVTGTVVANTGGTVQRGSSNLAYPGRNALVTATGTITGPRYNVILNGIISSQGGGAEYFPGSAAGISNTGGQYS